MFEKEAKIKLSEEEYKLAEEVIYPLFHKMRQNGDSLAKYGVECYLAGLNKANEWHYTKYELPSEDVPLLCMRGGNVYVAWFILGKWKGDKYNDVKKPYAWKEVVLPEPGLQMPMQEG